MKKIIVFIILSINFSIPVARSAGLATPETLAGEFIRAVNAKDREALRSLVNPKSIENLSPLEEKFLDEFLVKNFRKPIPDNRRVKVVGLEKGVVPFGDLMVWKVKPTHYFEVEFSTGEYSSTSIIRYIGKDGGRWYMLVPFPSAENMKLYEERLKSTGGNVEG